MNNKEDELKVLSENVPVDYEKKKELLLNEEQKRKKNK